MGFSHAHAWTELRWFDGNEDLARLSGRDGIRQPRAGQPAAQAGDFSPVAGAAQSLVLERAKALLAAAQRLASFPG